MQLASSQSQLVFNAANSSIEHLMFGSAGTCQDYQNYTRCKLY